MKMVEATDIEGTLLGIVVHDIGIGFVLWFCNNLIMQFHRSLNQHL